jgi:hypothetical protein
MATIQNSKGKIKNDGSLVPVMLSGGTLELISEDTRGCVG